MKQRPPPAPGGPPAPVQRGHQQADDGAWHGALRDLEGVGPQQRSLCAAHWQLVCAWAASANLTAIDQVGQAAWLHYRDSLAALPLLGAGSVLDVGSGAGFPGLVLAICRPQQPFWLVEPRRRRANFLRLAAAELRLDNITVACCRIEAPPPRQFHQAVTRATFSGSPPHQLLAAWLRPGASVLAYRSAEAPPWPGGQVALAYTLTPPAGPPRRRRVDRLQAGLPPAA